MNQAARKRVAAEKGGEDALKPWNLLHVLAGDVEKVKSASIHTPRFPKIGQTPAWLKESSQNL